MRIALLVRPGIDFVSLVFALLRLGAVQVLIDPGMGLRNVIRSLADVRPEGFISSASGADREIIDCLAIFLGAGFNITVGRTEALGRNNAQRNPPAWRSPVAVSIDQHDRRYARRHHLHQRQHRTRQGRLVSPRQF